MAVRARLPGRPVTMEQKADEGGDPEEEHEGRPDVPLASGEPEPAPSPPGGHGQAVATASVAASDGQTSRNKMLSVLG